MQGYSIHLLFHLIAVVIGLVCGVAAGLWLFGTLATAMWVFLGAALLGIALLAVQTFSLRSTPSGQPAVRSRQAEAGPPPRTGTRPDRHDINEPVARSSLQRPSGEQPR